MRMPGEESGEWSRRKVAIVLAAAGIVVVGYWLISREIESIQDEIKTLVGAAGEADTALASARYTPGRSAMTAAATPPATTAASTIQTARRRSTR